MFYLFLIGIGPLCECECSCWGWGWVDGEHFLRDDDKL